ncbi:hypothetical protein [Brevundimonas sp.]|uniref:hypothetical protein n=1 Tax=Brevundimonas sp. TaxID=1871086 RepID=UPI0025F37979|nr:hypothetical protein [Brevundimonas sp.]
MRRAEIEGLDGRQAYWVAALTAPERDWPAAPGCRKGARYLVGPGLGASRQDFETFESRLECLQWILEHRSDLNRALPGAAFRAVRLDRWLLGMD